MEVILSTHNPSKAEQIKAIFAELPITVLTLDEAGIPGEAVEDGDTLHSNALKKALYAHTHMKNKKWAMADDTGLFIDALNGLPGVRAARWAGEYATTDQITQHTLNALKGETNRAAIFETVVALVSPKRMQYFFRGQVLGTILEQPRVKPQPKMPYSSIFVPDGETMVWAEMSVEYENKISHRGKAFTQVRKFLENFVPIDPRIRS